MFMCFQFLTSDCCTYVYTDFFIFVILCCYLIASYHFSCSWLHFSNCLMLRYQLRCYSIAWICQLMWTWQSWWWSDWCLTAEDWELLLDICIVVMFRHLQHKKTRQHALSLVETLFPDVVLKQALSLPSIHLGEVQQSVVASLVWLSTNCQLWLKWLTLAWW